MPVDVTTDVGRVRLLIADMTEGDFIFPDSNIEAFLDMEDGDLLLASAQALEVMASNEAMVMKKIRLLDLETDGPAVSAELRQLAKSYRDRAEQDVIFEIATMNVDVFTERHLVANKYGLVFG